MSIQSAFADAKKAGRCAFIPYLTAGDPDLEATARFVKALAESGADVIELGIPFSDPVADGPTNQLAAARALASGTTLTKVLELVGRLRKSGLNTPIVIFTYLNPVFRMGFETFARSARLSGVSGALVVDLPPEEAGRAYLPAMRVENLETIFLASPTTARSRLPLIDSSTRGFVYYVSRAGVTGAQDSLSGSVVSELDTLRSEIKNPIGVGFGISTPEHARALAPHADGVIVGSALVKIIERHGAAGLDAAEKEIRALATSIVKELKRS